MEEISLKELIEILNRYRLLIIGVIITSVVFSFVYSFFILEPIYYSQAEIEISGINTGVGIFEQKNHSAAITNELVDQSKNPQFKEQVSGVLADRGIQINGTDLSEILSLNIGKNGKTIILSVRYKVKKDVAQIANIAIDVLNQYSTDYLKKELKEMLAYSEERMEIGKANIEKALSKYKVYLAGPESIRKLQSEVNFSESLLVQLKADLISGNIGISSSKNQLEQDIRKLEGEIELLKEKLLEEYSKDKLYDEELKSLFRVYAPLEDDYNRLKLAELYQYNRSNIDILSYAVEPESDSSPDRKTIIILSLYAGIGIALLLVFTIEYCKHKKIK